VNYSNKIDTTFFSEEYYDENDMKINAYVYDEFDNKIEKKELRNGNY